MNERQDSEHRASSGGDQRSGSGGNSSDRGRDGNRNNRSRNSDGGNRGGNNRGSGDARGDAAAAPAGGRPKIGDSRPAPGSGGDQSSRGQDSGSNGGGSNGGGSNGGSGNRNRRGGRGRGGSGGGSQDGGSNNGGSNNGGSNNGGSNNRGSNNRGNGDSNDGGQNRSGRNRNQGGNRNGDGRNSDGRDGRNSDGGNRGGNNQRGGNDQGGNQGGDGNRKRRRGGRGRGKRNPAVQGGGIDGPIELDEETLARRRGKERDGKPIGRYLMAVHVQDQSRHIAILEGRSLIEYYVSRPTDDATQIHGNIYLGRVQNVLPGMEAAFIDIATPKNAVLYHGDLNYDPKDFEGRATPRIEQVLKAKELILCQVTKNPIAHKGARLTQEISLPGRFVVLMPNNSTYGISKRLPEKERKRLRQILDEVKPAQHGVIVRTAAEDVTAEELQRDVSRLLNQWERISELAKDTKGGARLLYREPDMAVRLIREEFTKEYRGVVIDDQQLFEEVHGYVSSVTPALSDRIEHFDMSKEKLSLFERHHVHEQFHKALDKKVWLPSGGSLIIEHTEALTVIDVNTGKNVGKSNLEDTVFHNNVEAAKEVARQLRLRDIGGIIVIDFVDMENRKNRAKVAETFREALARDKTRTQVYEISDLGLIEMTRKRIGEGLLESVSGQCPTCEGSGAILEEGLL